MEKVVLEEYDKAKLNPAKPAGEGKEPPTPSGENPVEKV